MIGADIGLALIVAIVLSWVLLRYTKQGGPWENRWAIGSVVFLCAWAGGAWFAPFHASGWVVYWVPFTVVGLVAALLIAIASPTHDLDTEADRKEFEREQAAVSISVGVAFYTLIAGLVAVVISAYLYH